MRVGPELEIPSVETITLAVKGDDDLRADAGDMGASITSSKVRSAYMNPSLLTRSRVGDTVLHSWEVLAKILAYEDAVDLVCDVGM